MSEFYTKEDKVIGELDEVRELEKKIRAETIDSVLSTISINDSYFYAKMAIMKMSPAEDPFGSKVKAITEISLANSAEFQTEKMTNDRRVVQTKKIRTSIIMDADVALNNQKEDLMMLVYEEVSKEIAKDLFQANAKNIMSSFKSF